MKRILSVLLICIISVSFLSMYTYAENYVEISTAADILAIIENPNGNYRLTSDIILSTEELSSIKTPYLIPEFFGIFDGNGHTISGFKNINNNLIGSLQNAGGFFGINNGNIINTIFSNFNINQSYFDDFDDVQTYVGLLVGINNGKLSDCSVINGKISVSNHTTSKAPYSVVTNGVYVGGICGLNNGVVKNCSSSGTAFAEATATYNDALNNSVASGIVGLDNNMKKQMNTKIEDCSSKMDLISGYCAGGIVGETNYTIVSGCSFEGTVSAINYAGGIVGRVSYNTSILTCVNFGNIYSAEKCGGIVSEMANSIVKQCANFGSIKNFNEKAVAKIYTGGICGYSFTSVIENCFNVGQISVNAPGVTSYIYVGGICGRQTKTNESENYIRYCYNAGSVSAVSTKLNETGSIVGRITDSTAENCYYLSGTWQTASGNGIISSTVLNSEDKTNSKVFIGFDFNQIWIMGKEGPVLRGCLKICNSVPSLPEIVSVAKTSLTVLSIPGCEYSVNGTDWQQSNIFEKLTPDTQYMVYTRYAQTEKFFPSQKSEPILVRTLKEEIKKLDKPVLQNRTQTSITLVYVEGYEYRIGENGTWQKISVFQNLIPDTEYLFYVRSLDSDVSDPLLVKTLKTIAGDINKSGKVDLFDAMKVFLHVAGKIVLEDDAFISADIDKNGNIKIDDAMKIFNILAGK
ncbi:MAG: hypothetical protein DBX47_03130 [Clostridiales bacterium]|nr:MAG: hypothetical protein DBX47_03130 [Clostridiales bacterium]